MPGLIRLWKKWIDAPGDLMNDLSGGQEFKDVSDREPCAGGLRANGKFPKG